MWEYGNYGLGALLLFGAAGIPWVTRRRTRIPLPEAA